MRGSWHKLCSRVKRNLINGCSWINIYIKLQIHPELSETNWIHQKWAMLLGGDCRCYWQGFLPLSHWIFHPKFWYFDTIAVNISLQVSILEHYFACKEIKQRFRLLSIGNRDSGRPLMNVDLRFFSALMMIFKSSDQFLFVKGLW